MKILLLMSLILLCGGTLGGWAMANTMGGNLAGISFLRSGVTFSAILFALQIFLFVMARKRLFYNLIFYSALLISLIWIMMCLVLPIYWMSTISIMVKVGIFIFTAVLFFCNGCEGWRKFKKRWGEKNPVPQKYYNPKKSSLDWYKITKSLHISVSVYIPGVPQSVVPFLPVLIILSMMIGPSLRKLYPIVGAFVWGFPWIVVASVFVQLLSIGIAQAVKVIDIEGQLGAKIRSEIH